jgi:IPT/TIG domain
VTDAGVNFVAEPAGVGRRVSVGIYRLDVGPPVGMSISTGPEATVAAEQRTELQRAIAHDHKDEKTQRGVVDLVERSSERSDEITGHVERADSLWKEIAAGRLDVGTVNSEIDNFLALLQKLDRSGRFDEQLRLARSLSRLLAVAQRWLDLLRSLRETLAAAERHGDKSARAWALHELGTLHLAGHDLLGADRELSRAADLRRELGEPRGLAATERNLMVLCRTLRQLMRDGRMRERRSLRRLLHAPFALVVALFVLVFAAATVAIAAIGLFSGGSAHAATVPTVAQIVPSNGPAAGGTTVTITGTKLANTTAVKFGHTDGTNLKPISATRLQVTAPPGSGTVPVTVVTTQGTSAASAAAHFTYTAAAAPAVSGLSPNSGPAAGGTIVTITGTRLANATAVKFGHTDGMNLKPISATQLQITAPPGSGTVAVTVVTPQGRSPANSTTQFQYILPRTARTVTQVTPDSGAATGGTVVTITGTGLSNTSAVRFGSATGTNLHPFSDTQLQITTPPGSGTVSVTVVTPQGNSAQSPHAQFSYTATAAGPTIGGLAPTTGSAAGGTIVTITGTGLSQAQSVTFGGNAGTDLSRISDTQLQVTTPPGSGTVPVAVVSAAGKSAPGRAANFTYTSAPPTITTITPAKASPGTAVTITGTGLATAKRVSFGGADGTSVHPNSDTSLTVIVPPVADSQPCDVRVRVTVTAGGGTSAPHPFAYGCG